MPDNNSGKLQYQNISWGRVFLNTFLFLLACFIGGIIYLFVLSQNLPSIAELQRFNHGGILGEHPDRNVPGIEINGGSLGHGFSVASGMALADKIDKSNKKTFVLLGDGEINEGSVWEAAMSAAKHRLNNLSVFVDYNKLQSYGTVREVMNLEPLVDKWKSFGFKVQEVDGHDTQALQDLMVKLPFDSVCPSTIICHTIKGSPQCFFRFGETNKTPQTFSRPSHAILA